MASQPAGTVTLLFTDIEGSTRLLEQLGGERYARALDLHRRLLRQCFDRHDGYEVDCEGDAFFVAFSRAEEAMAAASEAQEALARTVWPSGLELRTRMGLHTGEPLVVPPKYVGMDVHKAARIMAAAHGGQVLVSHSTFGLLPGHLGLRDLGEHRLKDMSAPERLWQLGDDEFLPLRSLYRTNLPVQATPLVGRGRELAELTSALRNGTRLLTLTGAGGTGKTRLALQAAAELADDYPEGVWFVPLAGVSEPVLVEPTIAQTVGAGEHLGEDLVGKRLLLVLDNFEQVIEAAPLVAELLSVASSMRVLATSRERLSLTAEEEYVVPTLPLEDGVALFAERARRLDRGFEVDEHVWEIVRRLDGLPLAIELASSRVKVLSAEQIAERLGHSIDLVGGGGRDLPERQRTLRATIDWSYELLTLEEQLLFARLSVFAREFELEAAEAVAGATADTIGSLVDKSLVRREGGGKFSLLAPLRTYAENCLIASGDDLALSTRHADYILEQIGSGRVVDASRLARLDTLQADLMHAIESMHAAGDSDREARLIGFPRGYWHARGLGRELERVTERALERDDLSVTAREWLIHQRGLQAVVRGDGPLAVEALSELLRIRRELEDPDEIAFAIGALAQAHTINGDHEAARDLHEEALRLCRAGAGGPVALAAQLLNHASLLLALGELDAAGSEFEEARERWVEIGDDFGLGATEDGRALVALARGRLDDARDAWLTALDYSRRAADAGTTMCASEGLAAVAAKVGDLALAAELAGVAAGIRDAAGVAMEPATQAISDETRQVLRLELSDRKVVADAFAAGRAGAACDDPAGWVLARLSR